jgi:hypothetical protein
MSAQIRNYFLDRDLRYVFSYTIDLSMNRQEIGPVPGGVRVNIFTLGGELFQVLNERSPWAENNIRGTVLPGGGDWAFLGDDDVGRVDVRIAFRTEDNAYLESRYRGVFPLGPGGFREFLREFDSRGEPVKLLGTEKKPFFASVFIAPTFETSHPRYKWLTKLQCAGFGRVKIVHGSAREMSIDVYALA